MWCQCNDPDAGGSRNSRYRNWKKKITTTLSYMIYDVSTTFVLKENPDDVWQSKGDWLLAEWHDKRGRVTPICVGKPAIIGSDNGLSLGQSQAFIWPNAGILLIGNLGINFTEILIEILTFSFKKNALENVFCEMASILSGPQCVKPSAATLMINARLIYIYIYIYVGKVMVIYQVQDIRSHSYTLREILWKHAQRLLHKC